jgi:sugar/nucleoside kinase (ribokinase family)
VGAGDAFNAGFICSRVSGGTVREAIYWGNAVAAFTVSRAGARSHPTQAELDQLLLRRTSDG